MSDDEGQASVAMVLKADVIQHDFGDKEVEKIINEIVVDVIQNDIRLDDTPENREAIKDYIRMEFILAIKCGQVYDKPESLTASDERMIRSAAKMKMDGRTEIWGDVKGEPGKEKFLGTVREHVKKKIIKAKTEVDPIDKPRKSK